MPLTPDQLIKAESIINNATMHAIGENLLDKTDWEADWVMSQTDGDGYPAASMITAAKADGFNWVAFCTETKGNKAKRAAYDPRACIYLFNSKTFTGISLIGDIEVRTDADTKRRMWYKALNDHYSGPQDERYCVLLFRPKRYNIFIDFQSHYGEL